MKKTKKNKTEKEHLHPEVRINRPKMYFMNSSEAVIAYCKVVAYLNPPINKQYLASL